MVTGGVPLLQLLIQAYDTADPNNVATTTLIITINRNEHSPVFSPQFYSASIHDYDPKGLSVVAVSASDNDTAVRNLAQGKPSIGVVS